MMIAVNENKFFETAGDVTVYADMEALAQNLEKIDVENNEYFAIDQEGVRLELQVSMGAIIAKKNHLTGSCIHVLRDWLGVSPSEDHTERMRAIAVSVRERQNTGAFALFVALTFFVGVTAWLLSA